MNVRVYEVEAMTLIRENLLRVHPNPTRPPVSYNNYYDAYNYWRRYYCHNVIGQDNGEHYSWSIIGEEIE